MRFFLFGFRFFQKRPPCLFSIKKKKTKIGKNGCFINISRWMGCGER